MQINEIKKSKISKEKICKIRNQKWNGEIVLILSAWRSTSKISRNMYCPGCGCRNDNHEQIYCDRCLSAREVNDFLRLCFDRGYPYDAIIGLLAGKGEQMSIKTLKRRLKALGLKRKGNQFDDDHLRHVIQEEMQDAGSLAGYRSIWHALRLRHGMHVSSHHVSRIMKEIDPLGVKERKRRRLHRRIYRSEGPNACWHLDGNYHTFNSCCAG